MHNSHQDTHQSQQKAAEYHNPASHARVTAAQGHEKEDHLTGHEHSRQALEHTNKNYQQSQQEHEPAQTEHAKNVPTHEATEQEIAVLAYRIWQDRGSPQGSSKRDWFQAIEELQPRK